MSLNLEQIRKWETTKTESGGFEFGTGKLVAVSESEVIGLAVELLKARPEVRVRQWYDQIALHPVERYDLGENLPAGAYLIVPLSILGEQ